jgi:histidine ammonia-lyase
MVQLRIDGEKLTIEDVVEVARNKANVVLTEEAKARVRKSREVLERLVVEGQVIYGVNTGFGVLSNIRVPPENAKELQVNLIRSHSAGVGPALDTEIVRAVMLLRANTLAKSNSGIRLETLETLVQMLNKRVHPVIPSRGSVGASGDLAPLSHMILVLIGEGKAEYQGRILGGKEALHAAGIEPVQLEFKEGIALNNGTQLMTGIAALAIFDAENLVKTCEAATALTLEALLGVSDAFDRRIHRVRPHPGQVAAAGHVRRLFAGSRLVQTGKAAMADGRRPHDPYSLRCAPQVVGSAREAVAYVRRIVEVELNSATDNPLVFPEDGTCFSGGNFHGQPISFALDILGVALTMLGNVSERRIALLVDEKMSNGLPAFLIPPEVKAGLNSGFMTLQYTAAALASENKVLAHPACADSIPTSAGFEDFVSMGVTAAHKCLRILENVDYVFAIELLCGAQAVEFRGTGKMGRGTRKIYDVVRKMVPRIVEDMVLSDYIEKIKAVVEKGEFSHILDRLAR